ncbi:hypothetical protein [Haloferax volcanii]|uniref:hypothetical protein n=1 Tax=Haloferax volcanii TaxID=2246 RepID=UPI00249C298D|nr:hypothetical protein [Haloferax alexandrinus]WEL29873.1 hypothetical protein HBNXHx_1767 [Haloferax alexandrinus]
MSDDDTRADRRERYEQILRIVEFQTGDPQRPFASKAHVKRLAVQAGVPLGKVDLAMRAAVENGDLLEWGSRVARSDEESLVDIVEHYGSLVDECNKRIRAKRRGDEE